MHGAEDPLLPLNIQYGFFQKHRGGFCLIRTVNQKLDYYYGEFYFSHTFSEDKNDYVNGFGFDLDAELARQKSKNEYIEKKMSLSSRGHLNFRFSNEHMVDADTIYELGDFIQFKDFYDCRHIVPAQDYYLTSTSGFAAGSDVHSARLRALLEVIERDSFFVAWYTDTSGTVLQELEALIFLDERLKPAAKALDAIFVALPTVFKCYIVACIIPNAHKGFVVGLSAGLSFGPTINKAMLEAMFFKYFILNKSSHIFDKSSDISKFGGYLSHLDYFWFRGASSYARLYNCRIDRARILRVNNCILSSLRNNYSQTELIDSMEKFKIIPMFRDVYVDIKHNVNIAHARALNLIQQHTVGSEEQDFDILKLRYPLSRVTWPLYGIHAFT